MAVSIFRTCVLYFSIIIALRVMGKRQIGEMQPSELVVTILLSELASVPIQDTGKPLLSGMVPIIILVALEIILSGVLIKSHKMRVLFEGSPSMLIQKGKVKEAELRRNHLTLPELMEELRIQGICDISTVNYAILETNGQLSVLQYGEHLPPTANMLKIDPEDAGLPLTMVLDGRVELGNLRAQGLEPSWLHAEMRRRSIGSVGDIFLLTRDELGRVYCQLKDRTI